MSPGETMPATDPTTMPSTATPTPNGTREARRIFEELLDEVNYATVLAEVPMRDGRGLFAEFSAPKRKRERWELVQDLLRASRRLPDSIYILLLDPPPGVRPKSYRILVGVIPGVKFTIVADRRRFENQMERAMDAALRSDVDP